MSLTVPAALTEAIRSWSRGEGVTPYMTLLAAFYAWLHRHTGRTDLAVGSPVAGRRHREIEGVVGLFVNTLVLRAGIEPAMPFRDLVTHVRAMVLDAQAHQDVPFDLVVEDLHPGRDLSRHPLFEAMFSLERPAVPATAFAGVRLQPLALESPTAKFDLSLTILESAGTLTASLQYSADLFERETAAQMLRHYLALIEVAVAAPDRRIAELPLLTSGERRHILADWNRTGRAYPPAGGIHRLVEEQVDRTPEHIAVVSGPDRLTYAELDRQANQLAHRLMQIGAGPGDRVAICLERSAAMVVSLLAVLKTGAAYVAVAPDYPRDRIAFMLTNAGAAAVVTTSSLTVDLPADVPIVRLDLEALTLASFDAARPDLVTDGEAPAYVLYTSGSTGQPKGVVIPHRALVNHMRWFLEAFGLSADDRVLQKTPFSFDASVWEFYAPLLCGGTLVVAEPDGHRDPAYLCRVIRETGVTTLQVVPSLLALLLEEPQFAACATLTRIFCGGEALPPSLRERFFAKSRARLINLYGPTEVTIDSVAWECRPDESGAVVPIGRPIANVQAYVLDAAFEPLPAGLPGELYLGGVGVGLGYLGRPDLTAAAFVPDAFGDVPGGRLYRTGDLARFRADGVIEFLGRLDGQVKLRGFRIELGEIEAVLASHPSVRQAAAIVREDRPGEPRLVAYVSPAGGHEPETTALRAWLASRLPPYQVPAALVVLDTLPQLPNGKIDRASLPVPPAPPAAAPSDEAPRSSQEAALLGIWRDVLGRPAIGLHDNFFELGGDSILSVQVASRARIQGLTLTPKLIFQHQTVAELVAAMASADDAASAPDAPMTGSIVMTPMQHWFFAQDVAEPQHWNQAVLLDVPAGFDHDLAQRCLNEVVRCHDALRLHLAPPDDRSRLVCAPPGTAAPFVRHDCTAIGDDRWPAALAAAVADEQARIDLVHGPIIRAAWFDRGAARTGRLLLAVHHLAVDAVSWRILLDDLGHLFERAVRGETLALPARTASLSAWSSRLAGWASSAAARREVEYLDLAGHRRVGRTAARCRGSGRGESRGHGGDGSPRSRCRDDGHAGAGDRSRAPARHRRAAARRPRACAGRLDRPAVGLARSRGPGTDPAGPRRSGRLANRRLVHRAVSDAAGRAVRRRRRSLAGGRAQPAAGGPASRGRLRRPALAASGRQRAPAAGGPAAPRAGVQLSRTVRAGVGRRRGIRPGGGTGRRDACGCRTPSASHRAERRHRRRTTDARLDVQHDESSRRHDRTAVGVVRRRAPAVRPERSGRRSGAGLRRLRPQPPRPGPAARPAEVVHPRKSWPYRSTAPISKTSTSCHRSSRACCSMPCATRPAAPTSSN